MYTCHLIAVVTGYRRRAFLAPVERKQALVLGCSLFLQACCCLPASRAPLPLPVTIPAIQDCAHEEEPVHRATLENSVVAAFSVPRWRESGVGGWTTCLGAVGSGSSAKKAHHITSTPFQKESVGDCVSSKQTAPLLFYRLHMPTSTIVIGSFIIYTAIPSHLSPPTHTYYHSWLH